MDDVKEELAESRSMDDVKEELSLIRKLLEVIMWKMLGEDDFADAALLNYAEVRKEEEA